MNQKKIIDAMMEAKKFVKRAEKVLLESRDDDCMFIAGNGRTASLRRQSMELTRALAEMRKA